MRIPLTLNPVFPMAMVCLPSRMRALSHELHPIPTGAGEVSADLSGVRAVVFDVYGTLFASASGDIEGVEGSGIEERFRQAFASMGWSLPPDNASLWDAYRETIAGFHASARNKGIPHPEVDIRAVWGSILGRLFPDRVFSQDDLEQISIEVEARINPVWPMPGVYEVLAALKEMGFALGIVSNAQFYTPLLFEAFSGTVLAGHGFDPGLCQWSWEGGRAKPDTWMYEQVRSALETRGIGPGACLFVGNDMLKDVVPAVQCGIRTALFAGDQRSLRRREGDPRCNGIHPDVVITRLDSLLRMLRR